jgi:phospholipid N-methyltransferase
MRLILVVLLFIPLMAISCIDKEFESELKFVQSIIDYPEKMDSIIINSPFIMN